jgi:ABC-type sugar transport system substrate-binding protein
VIPAIEKAVEEGIVVQCLDMKSDTPLCEHCGTDFRDMGIVAAQRIVELCQEDLASTGKCLVGLTRAAGAYSQDLRLEGINSVLKDYPDIQIVADVDDQYQPDVTVTAAQQILVANPDLRVLHCLHGEGAKAMAQAVRNSGLEPNKDVYIIGNDLGSTTLECMQAGDCDSTVAQDMYMMGAYAFLNAYMKVNQFMDHTLFEGKHSVPLINPGTGLVTQETMGSLLENVREIEEMFR